MFGSVRYFLYLCSIEIEEEMSTPRAERTKLINLFVNLLINQF